MECLHFFKSAFDSQKINVLLLESNLGILTVILCSVRAHDLDYDSYKQGQGVRQ